MANNNNNNKEGKVTAGELFDKLKGKNTDVANMAEVDEVQLAEETNDAIHSIHGFSIDVSAKEDSDSELDINELLKKYMPEYDEQKKDAADTGVLSKLKNSSNMTLEDLPYGMEDGVGTEDDDRLISALDSVFGPEGEEFIPSNAEDAYAEDEYMADESVEDSEGYSEELWDDPSDGREAKKKNKKEKKPFFLFGFGRKKKAAEQEEATFAEEDEIPYDTQSAEFASPAEEFSPDEAAFEAEADLSEEEQLESLAASVDEVSFSTDIRLGDLAALENALNDPQPVNRITPEMRKAPQSEEKLLDRLEELEKEEAAAVSPAADAAEAPVEASVDEVAASEDFVDAEELFAVDGEEEISEDAAIEEEYEEVDPTDLNLRVAFGLDEEEETKVHPAAKSLGDELEAKQYRREKRAKLDRAEFVDKTQIPKIRKEYQHRLLALWIKLGVAILAAVALMWFENVTFFTDLFTGSPKQFAGAFDPAVYPVVYIMVSLQLMLIACLAAYEQIMDGFKYLFRGIPKAETLLSVLFTAGVVYSAVMARLIESPEEPVMFNFAVALAAVLTLVYALYNTRREKMNFDIVSSKKTKHIVRRLPDEEARCETRAFMDETDACDVMKVEKTDFIDGFFGRMYQPDSTVTVFMACMMSIAAALAILVGFFVSLRGGDGADVLKAAYMTLLVTAPVSVLVSFSYPFYRATQAANEYDTAIIGETSLAEYSDASIISFDDKNVFPSYGVKIQNIKIYNNARVDRVLYYAASVFSHAGGPLQDVFEVATLEMGHSEDVQIFDTEAGFLATQVNGVNIIFGSYNKLTEKGFVIPAENASDDIDFSSELSIMYMFREDKLVAKIYIKYVMDGDIDLILKQFQGTGLYVCVRTFDPNIDERMIAKKLNMRRIPLKVVRYGSAEEVTKYEAKVDSGLVTSASPKSLLQVIAYCDKVLHTRKASIALSVLSVIVGIAIIGLMILSGTVGAVNSLLIAVYHLLWLIPAVLCAKVFIR